MALTTIGAALGLLIGQAISVGSKRKRAKKRIEKFNRWAKQTLLQFKRDGIYLWRDGNPEMLPWVDVSRFKFDDERLYLLMNYSDAFVVPVGVIGRENVDQTRNWLLENNVDEVR